MRKDTKKHNKMWKDTINRSHLNARRREETWKDTKKTSDTRNLGLGFRARVRINTIVLILHGQNRFVLFFELLKRFESHFWFIFPSNWFYLAAKIIIPSLIKQSQSLGNISCLFKFNHVLFESFHILVWPHKTSVMEKMIVMDLLFFPSIIYKKFCNKWNSCQENVCEPSNNHAQRDFYLVLQPQILRDILWSFSTLSVLHFPILHKSSTHLAPRSGYVKSRQAGDRWYVEQPNSLGTGQHLNALGRWYFSIQWLRKPAQYEYCPYSKQLQPTIGNNLQRKSWNSKKHGM